MTVSNECDAESDNARIGVCHGSLGDRRFNLWFDDILELSQSFLEHHPSEFIIVTVKCDNLDPKKFLTVWKKSCVTTVSV